MIDVGGWETLRASEPWVRGLLAIVQKGDALPVKELAVITLTRVYVLLQPYQTLVREIGTPTIPEFVKACLQVVKGSAPFSVAETICEAFSSLASLYPTTFRPFGSQIRGAVRGYLAPTLSDGVLVPVSLRRAARKVVISLHCVAAKAGGSEEWAKIVDGLLRELHGTADQVFRAVDESWEGTSGYNRSRVDPDGEPHGGGDSVDQLPAWTGVSSGAERIIGIFAYLSDCLRYATKTPVVIPVSAFMDAISRVCLIAKISKSQTWEQAVQANAAIGRDEKEELWSVIPDVHISALELLSTMLQRFNRAMIPLIPEALDHLVRVFKSGISNPSVRTTGCKLLSSTLPLTGPTMSKSTVTMLEPIIAACCRDLQEDAGFLKPPKTASKDKGLANADLFLQPQASTETAVHLDAEHKAIASELLVGLLSHLPQGHLKPTHRGLLDKTAILTRSRDGMLASVLNPYKDQRGRMYPSILPHLSQQYPHDQGVEILRSNLRVGVLGGSDLVAEVAEVEDEEMDEDEHVEEESGESLEEIVKPALAASNIELPIQQNVFQGTTPNAFSVAEARPDSPSKRKHEDASAEPESKRQELDTTAVKAPTPDEDDDSDSDESVHLNMELDDDEDEDEDE